jgi:hypothetical protein
LAQSRPALNQSQNFNLKAQMRKAIITFFDELKESLEKMQKEKLDEFHKLFQESNFINI